MKFKDRVEKTFEKYGESFLINGVTPVKGFFQQLDQARMSMYFDRIEQDWIERPGLVVLIAASVSVQTGNSVVRDGRSYTVAKMAKQRIKDTVVMQILMLT